MENAQSPEPCAVGGRFFAQLPLFAQVAGSAAERAERDEKRRM
jgi:hypothetical protein